MMKTHGVLLRGGNSVLLENSQRYIKIREGTNQENGSDYVSTQAIHEIAVLLRRIEKLYKDSIFKPVDLADMWHELLPFGVNGRLEFFGSYLGKYSAESISLVVYVTILSCDLYKIEEARDFYVNNQHDEELLISSRKITWRDKKCFKFRKSIIPRSWGVNHIRKVCKTVRITEEKK